MILLAKNEPIKIATRELTIQITPTIRRLLSKNIWNDSLFFSKRFIKFLEEP